ncbi:MAG: FecR domain-containing protein [Microcoleus sp. PH2017_10_PVI_O_A]|uniref:FecR family protein n=1 Tax=unclassified Microcoleus TaxID=2642155 RepID=UPI001D52EF6D|nr:MULTISPECIES: FecR family protein [unclassified Microcoleus]TAE79538.1 MAG: iron dicitrate transport regulator FecR [Oscillatoriales cyanobacterium]MCC3408219.1 FecR domain-containing protein [Microcoleus sp. PH2017_10_PVI_O_A]MCC3462289.1 FecR domain-containing protein [Microcoleus sp. PH2017_11_PCY_U_A]MCC3480764.1 FecR domain-containing protein [Microcoleus sp. PH2017_12_PCY_D_A]MCC3530690.1 FecR domain-containing protein [Microcoleus sp. PH2017_21_RUC_O_A]
MNKIFRCWRSTKISLISLSLAVLATLPAFRSTIASPLSPSPKQQSNPTKIISVDRPPAPPTGSKSPKNLQTAAANPSPTKTINAQGTTAGRSLEIQEIRGTVTFKGRPAAVGDRLLAPGDEIITGPNSTARLAIDNNTGIVEVAEKTAVRISDLSSTSGENDTAIFVGRGRVRLSIGKTAAPTASAQTSAIILPNQIAALNTFSGLGKSERIAQQKKSARTAPVRVETPQGVAGVRGTSFGVSVGPDGKTGVETIEGSVGVSAKNDSEVVVGGGNATEIFPQTPPAPPSASPRLAELKVRSLFRLGGNIYRLSGQINPIDIIYVNNQAIKIDRQGKFTIQGILPASRRLKIVVRGSSVREKHYSLAVP